MSKISLQNDTVMPPIVLPAFCRPPERYTALALTILSGFVALVVCAETLEVVFAPKKSAKHSKGIKTAVFVGALITSFVDLVLAGISLRYAMDTAPLESLVTNFVVVFISRGLSVLFAWAAMHSHPQLVQEMATLSRAPMLEKMVQARVGVYEDPRHNEMARAARNGPETRRRGNRSTEPQV